MRIFHLALESDWQAAQRDGRYAVSTRGRTLAEEGFIHASRADQWQAVRSRFYADVDEPLVLLVIDTERLEAPVVEEPAVPGGDETFPHIFGVIEVGAVVNVLPLEGAQPAEGLGFETVAAQPPQPAATPAQPPQPAATPAQAPQPAATPATRPSLSRLFLEEMMFRLALATGVIVLATVAGLAAERAAGPTAAVVAALSTLVIAGAGAFVLTRRRDRRYQDARSES